MPKKLPIRAVLFDIGGVTIRWSDDIVYRHVAQMTGLNARTLQRVADHYMPLYDTGKVSEQEFWNRVSRQIKYMPGLHGLWLGNYGNHAVIDHEVLAIARQLRRKGFKVAALTNVIKAHYRYNRSHRIYNAFPVVFASCQLGMRKPELRFYRYAARRLGCKPAECLFFDDYMENIRAARKIGMQAVQFKSAAQLRRELRARKLL